MRKLHKIKNENGKLIEVELTQKRAIKFFCYECMGYQKSEVRNCTAPNCPLFPFRPLRFASEKGAKPASLVQG
jgi:hypothetical protein